MQELEKTALELKCLLAVMSGVDTNNAAALEEMPIVSGVALELAEKLYCAIVEKEV